MYNPKEPWEKYPVSILYNIAEPDKAYDKCHHHLNPFKSNELPTFIKWTSPFSSSGLLGVVFHSYSNFNRTSCKQRLESLIRHCSLWRLVLACTFCLCPAKRTLVLKGLNTFVVYVTHISCIVSSSNWIIIGYTAVLTI